MMFRHWITVFTISALIFGLTACASNRTSDESNRGFLGLFRGGTPQAGASSEAGIGVNSFLWRASLEVLSFMPLSEVDPFGGVIITDWYANPEFPTERFKVTAYILDTRLRADALSVQLFKQTIGENEAWADATIDAATRIQVENAILTRARQLRIQTLPD